MNNIINNNEEFDPKAWAYLNNNTEATEPQKMISSTESLPVNLLAQSEDIETQVNAITKSISSRGIDITNGYTNWLNLGFALADGLGEGGRSFYHNLSRLNSGYNSAECDKQYSACLHSHRQGITIKTFFMMAKEAGINLSEVAHDVCAKNANVSSFTNIQNDANSMDNADFGEIVPTNTMALLAQNTFSDKLRREDIPSYFWPVLDSQSDAVGRDKMLLGVCNIVSGILPPSLYSIYDRRKIFAPLYTIIYGRFATSKGDLEAVKQLVMPMKREMRRKYEEEKAEYEEAKSLWESKTKSDRGLEPKEPVLCSPFVTANSSASAVYRCMDANGGYGIMFETEADTLTNMLNKNEYGDYSDLLRKAHHHEAIAMVRVSDHINIEIDNPRLSVFLTCTGSQLPLLLPANNVANGLASRFLFYALPDGKVEFRNVFEGSDTPIEDIYKDLGEKLLPLYHTLQMREDHPIQFIMSKAQQEEFVSSFDAVLREQFSMLGDGIQGFIFRIALECYRFAMIFSILRRLSDWNCEESIFEDDEQALICDDRDFQSAMTIINCLINHTGRVYAVLGNKDNDPFSKTLEQPSPEMKSFFKNLPDGREFKTSEVVDIAAKANISERTAKRYLGDFVNKFLVLAHPKQGIYVKISAEGTNA